MARRKADPIQKLKEQIIQLPEEAADKLYLWFTAVREVKLEMSRQAKKDEKPK